MSPSAVVTAAISSTTLADGSKTAAAQRATIAEFPGLTAEARIGEPHETNRSAMGMERGHSRAGCFAAARSQFPGQTLSIPQPAYDARFASGPRHGRGDTAYFARTPLLASRPEM